MHKLSSEELRDHLATIDGWELDGTAIKKIFKFDDFNAAMDFMNKVAAVANQLNHHPDWSNSYNKVTINLSSHEASGLTEADFTLAQAADHAARAVTSE